MNAKKLAEEFGNSLIGRLVETFQAGEWPCCVAVVTQIEPDPSAPEIVFQICHPKHGSIGVFGHENVLLIVEREDLETVRQLLEWLESEVDGEPHSWIREEQP